MADTLIFLKIIGGDPKGPPAIRGESTAAGFEDLIEIESIQWRAGVPSQGESTAQPKFDPITLKKFVDSSTCTLLKWTKTRKRSQDPIKQMAITYVDMVLDKDGTKHALPVVEFKLYDCYVESVDLGAAASGKGVQLSESVTVSYNKVDVVYHPVGKDRAQRGKAMMFKGLAPGKV